jgi:tRNA (guanine6-N2)-methyltransferase
MKFLLTVFPGLTSLAVEELAAKTQLKPLSTARVRGSELIFVQTSTPAALLELRICEDVFVDIDTIKLTGQGSDLKLINVEFARGGGLASALRALTLLTGRQVLARAQYRVVVQADDAAWRSYRRVDIQAAAEAGLARAKPSWRLSPQEAPYELWVHQIGRSLQVSLRITTSLHRSRGGRVIEREAALRPTIAAAMVFAARPTDEDVWLDPMCGSGTILLERAAARRHGLLLGGDIDPAAVKATLANFGPRHKPVRIERMDARKLPLEDRSVDAYVTNLPWGHQIATASELPTMYSSLLKEAVRVVRPAGRIVLLTSEAEVLRRALRSYKTLRIIRVFANIEVLGRRAEMLVIAI